MVLQAVFIPSTDVFSSRTYSEESDEKPMRRRLRTSRLEESMESGKAFAMKITDHSDEKSMFDGFNMGLLWKLVWFTDDS